MARASVPSGACTVCRHVERGRIDYLAATGVAISPLAAQFDLSRDAVRRHYVNHVSDAFKASVKMGPFKAKEEWERASAEGQTSVLQNLQRMHAGYDALWLANIEAGAIMAAVTVGREMRALQMDIAKLTKEWSPSAQTITINNFLSQDWFEAHSAWLIGLMKAHPAIRDDVTKHLQEARQRAVNPPALMDITPESRA